MNYSTLLRTGAPVADTQRSLVDTYITDLLSALDSRSIASALGVAGIRCDVDVAERRATLLVASRLPHEAQNNGVIAQTMARLCADWPSKSDASAPLDALLERADALCAAQHDFAARAVHAKRSSAEDHGAYARACLEHTQALCALARAELARDGRSDDAALPVLTRLLPSWAVALAACGEGEGAEPTLLACLGALLETACASAEVVGGSGAGRSCVEERAGRFFVDSLVEAGDEVAEGALWGAASSGRRDASVGANVGLADKAILPLSPLQMLGLAGPAVKVTARGAGLAPRGGLPRADADIKVAACSAVDTVVGAVSVALRDCISGPKAWGQLARRRASLTQGRHFPDAPLLSTHRNIPPTVESALAGWLRLPFVGRRSGGAALSAEDRLGSALVAFDGTRASPTPRGLALRSWVTVSAGGKQKMLGSGANAFAGVEVAALAAFVQQWDDPTLGPVVMEAVRAIVDSGADPKSIPLPPSLLSAWVRVLDLRRALTDRSNTLKDEDLVLAGALDSIRKAGFVSSPRSADEVMEVDEAVPSLDGLPRTNAVEVFRRRGLHYLAAGASSGAVPVTGLFDSAVIAPGFERAAISALCGLAPGTLDTEALLGAPRVGSVSAFLMAAIESGIESRLCRVAFSERSAIGRNSSGHAVPLAVTLPSVSALATLSRQAQATHVAVWPAVTPDVFRGLSAPLTGRWMHPALEAAAAKAGGKDAAASDTASHFALALVLWGREGWMAEGKDVEEVCSEHQAVADRRLGAVQLCVRAVYGLHSTAPAAAHDLMVAAVTGARAAATASADVLCPLPEVAREGSLRADRAFCASAVVPVSFQAGVEGAPLATQRALKASGTSFLASACSAAVASLTALQGTLPSFGCCLLPSLDALCFAHSVGGADCSALGPVRAALRSAVSASSISVQLTASRTRAAAHALCGLGVNGQRWTPIRSRELLHGLACGMVDEAALLLHLYAGGIACGAPWAVNAALSEVTGGALGSRQLCVGTSDLGETTDPVGLSDCADGPWEKVYLSQSALQGAVTGGDFEDAAASDPDCPVYLPSGLERVGEPEELNENAYPTDVVDDGMKGEPAHARGESGLQAAHTCALLATVASVLEGAEGRLDASAFLRLHTSFLRLPPVARALAADFQRSEAAATLNLSSGLDEELPSDSPGFRSMQANGNDKGGFGFGGQWGASFGGPLGLPSLEESNALAKDAALSAAVPMVDARDRDPTAWVADDGDAGPTVMGDCVRDLEGVIEGAEDSRSALGCARLSYLLTGSCFLAVLPVLHVALASVTSMQAQHRAESALALLSPLVDDLRAALASEPLAFRSCGPSSSLPTVRFCLFQAARLSRELPRAEAATALAATGGFRTVAAILRDARLPSSIKQLGLTLLLLVLSHADPSAVDGEKLTSDLLSMAASACGTPDGRAAVMLGGMWGPGSGAELSCLAGSAVDALRLLQSAPAWSALVTTALLAAIDGGAEAARSTVAEHDSARKKRSSGNGGNGVDGDVSLACAALWVLGGTMAAAVGQPGLRLGVNVRLPSLQGGSTAAATALGTGIVTALSGSTGMALVAVAKGLQGLAAPHSAATAEGSAFVSVLIAPFAGWALLPEELWLPISALAVEAELVPATIDGLSLDSLRLCDSLCSLLALPALNASLIASGGEAGVARASSSVALSSEFTSLGSSASQRGSTSVHRSKGGAALGLSASTAALCELRARTAALVHVLLGSPGLAFFEPFVLSGGLSLLVRTALAPSLLPGFPTFASAAKVSAAHLLLDLSIPSAPSSAATGSIAFRERLVLPRAEALAPPSSRASPPAHPSVALVPLSDVRPTLVPTSLSLGSVAFSPVNKTRVEVRGALPALVLSKSAASASFSKLTSGELLPPPGAPQMKWETAATLSAITGNSKSRYWCYKALIESVDADGAAQRLLTEPPGAEPANYAAAQAAIAEAYARENAGGGMIVDDAMQVEERQASVSTPLPLAARDYPYGADALGAPSGGPYSLASPRMPGSGGSGATEEEEEEVSGTRNGDGPGAGTGRQSVAAARRADAMLEGCTLSEPLISDVRPRLPAGYTAVSRAMVIAGGNRGAGDSQAPATTGGGGGMHAVSPSHRSTLPFPYGAAVDSAGGVADEEAEPGPAPRHGSEGATADLTAWRGRSAASYWAATGPTGVRTFLAWAARVRIPRTVHLPATLPDGLALASPRIRPDLLSRGTLVWVEARPSPEALLAALPVPRASTHDKLASLCASVLAHAADACAILPAGLGGRRGALCTVLRHFVLELPVGGSAERAGAAREALSHLPSDPPAPSFSPTTYALPMTTVRLCVPRSTVFGRTGLLLEVPSYWLSLPVALDGSQLTDVPLAVRRGEEQAGRGMLALRLQVSIGHCTAASLTARASLQRLLSAWPSSLPLTVERLDPSDGPCTFETGAAALLSLLQVTAGEEGGLLSWGGAIARSKGAEGGPKHSAWGEPSASGALTAALQVTVASLLTAEGEHRPPAPSHGRWRCRARGCENASLCGQHTPACPMCGSRRPAPPVRSPRDRSLGSMMVDTCLTALAYAADAAVVAGAKGVTRASAHPLCASASPVTGGVVSFPGAPCLWIIFDERCATDPGDEGAFVELSAFDSGSEGGASSCGSVVGECIAHYSGQAHSYRPLLVRADSVSWRVAKGRAITGRPPRGWLQDGGWGVAFTATPLPGIMWASLSDVTRTPSLLWGASTLDWLLSGGLPHGTLLRGVAHNACTLRAVWEYLRAPSAPCKERVLGILHKLLAAPEYCLITPQHVDYAVSGAGDVVAALAEGPSRVPSATSHPDTERDYLQRLTPLPLGDVEDLRRLALVLKAKAEESGGGGLFLPSYLQRLLETVATADVVVRRVRCQLAVLGATQGQLYSNPGVLSGGGSAFLVPLSALSGLSEEGRLAISLSARSDSTVPTFFGTRAAEAHSCTVDTLMPPLMPVRPPLASHLSEIEALTCLREVLVALATRRRLPDAWMLRAIILATRETNDTSGITREQVLAGHYACVGGVAGEDEAIARHMTSFAARKGLATAMDVPPSRVEVTEEDVARFGALERFRGPAATLTLRVRVAIVLIVNNLYKRALPLIDMSPWNDGAAQKGGAAVVEGRAGSGREVVVPTQASPSQALQLLTVGALLKRVPHLLLTDSKDAMLAKALAVTETPGTSSVKLMLDNRASMASVASRVTAVPLTLCTFAQLVRHMLEAKVPDRSLRCRMNERDSLFEVAYVSLEGEAEAGMDWGGLYRNALSRSMADLFGEGDTSGVDLFVMSPSAAAARAAGGAPATDLPSGVYPLQGRSVPIGLGSDDAGAPSLIGEGGFVPNPRYCLFNAANGGTGKGPPRPLGASAPAPISPSAFALATAMYEWFGRILGISIRTRTADLDVDLAAVAWRMIAREPTGVADVMSLDPKLGSLLARVAQWWWASGSPGAGGEVHATEADAFAAEFGPLFFVAPESPLLHFVGDGGVAPPPVGVDADAAVIAQRWGSPLIPGGAATRVVPSNRARYVDLVAAAALAPYAHACAAIRRGMARIVPDRALDCCGWRDLRRLACGEPSVDLDTLLANTKYDNSGTYHAAHPVIKWFWQAMRSLSPEQLTQFVRFAWGRPNLPRGKWPLQPNGQPVRFTVVPQRGRYKGLPLAHTCFFLIELPEYKNYEDLRHALTTAITWGAGEAFLIA